MQRPDRLTSTLTNYSNLPAPSNNFSNLPAPSNNTYTTATGKVFQYKWVFQSQDPTPGEVKKLIALLVKHMMKLAFKGHVYKFGDKIFLQTKGGPIGLRLSGSVARLILLWFDKQLIKIAKLNQIKVHLYKRYIDDVEGVLSKIKIG